MYKAQNGETVLTPASSFLTQTSRKVHWRSYVTQSGYYIIFRKPCRITPWKQKLPIVELETEFAVFLPSRHDRRQVALATPTSPTVPRQS